MSQAEWFATAMGMPPLMGAAQQTPAGMAPFAAAPGLPTPANIWSAPLMMMSGMQMMQPIMAPLMGPLTSSVTGSMTGPLLGPVIGQATSPTPWPMMGSMFANPAAAPAQQRSAGRAANPAKRADPRRAASRAQRQKTSTGSWPASNQSGDALADLLALQSTLMTMPWQMLAAGGTGDGQKPAPGGSEADADSPSPAFPLAITAQAFQPRPRGEAGQTETHEPRPAVPFFAEHVPAAREINTGMPHAASDLPPGWSVLNLAIALPPKLNEVIYHLTMALQAASASRGPVDGPQITAWMDQGRPTITH